MVLITIVILDGLIHSSGSTLRVLGLPLSLRAQASNKLIQDQLRVVTWERYGGQRPAIFDAYFDETQRTASQKKRKRWYILLKEC